jgi:SAM-dependent methyltransferase
MTAAATSPTAYDAAFYAEQADGSLRSARVVVPLVMELVRPASVLDVGCGLGTWLAAFAEAGVADFLGTDGDYVDRAKLKIPADRFRPTDLTNPPPPGRTFDLAVCLEVAEHLPEKLAPKLVEYLTGAAPVVLFSAAIPGQGGTHHVNEQWPAFWQRLFAQRGFVRLDPIRPKVWRDNRVVWWYQQNVFLFVRESLLAERPALQAEYDLAKACPLELVHRYALERAERARTLGGMIRGFPCALWRAVKRLF